MPTLTGTLTFDLVCDDLPRFSRLSCLIPAVGLLAIPSLYFRGLNIFSLLCYVEALDYCLSIWSQ